MQDHSGTVLESQVDYLTVSAHGQDAATAMVDYAKLLAEVEHDKGNKLKPWRLMGYEGKHVGAVDYGQRDDACAILRLAGDIANRELTNALSLADAVTRIDLAVTHRPFQPDPHVGANLFFTAEQYYREHPTSALPWHTGAADGGYTAYIGKRGGDLFFRCYNKEAECKATHDRAGAVRYKGCWRYELEVEKGNPIRIAEQIADRKDREQYVQTYVHNYMSDHGLTPPFPSNGGRVILPGFRRRSDADSKIAHLAKSVRPSIDFLRDAGRLADALHALGLAENS